MKRILLILILFSIFVLALPSATTYYSYGSTFYYVLTRDDAIVNPSTSIHFASDYTGLNEVSTVDLDAATAVQYYLVFSSNEAKAHSLSLTFSPLVDESTGNTVPRYTVDAMRHPEYTASVFAGGSLTVDNAVSRSAAIQITTDSDDYKSQLGTERKLDYVYAIAYSIPNVELLAPGSYSSNVKVTLESK